MDEYQLELFHVPRIEISHGREIIAGYDSKGWWMFFARPVGESGPFFNEFAGPLTDPRGTSGEGEAIDELGNLVPGFNPPSSYRKHLQGLRWDRRCIAMGIDYVPLPGESAAGEGDESGQYG